MTCPKHLNLPAPMASSIGLMWNSSYMSAFRIFVFPRDTGELSYHQLGYDCLIFSIWKNRVGFHVDGTSVLLVQPLDGHLHSDNSGPVVVGALFVSWRHNTWQ